MYSLVSLEKIISFFLKFGIDISLFTNFELSLLIILSNIFVAIFYILVFSLVYKIALKILNWWF